MKRTNLYIAVAALALASCSKNEINNDSPTANDPNMISFNSSTGTTRADTSDFTAVKGGFTVLGLKATQTAVADAFIKGDETNSVYKFDNSKWGWTVPADKNWPEVEAEYPLTFYAEYPKVDLSTNTDLNKAVEVALPMADQVDYLVAHSQVMVRPSTGFAPLNFKHILSNLVFKIESRDKYAVHIQSIRVVNTATKGRTFDYATMAYDVEPTPYTDLAATDGTYDADKGYFYNMNVALGTPWSFTAATGTTVAMVPSISGIMMQMPQLALPSYWIEGNTTDGLGKFMVDATAWKAGTEADAAAKLNAWYTALVTAADQPGMKGSDGWKGARIEVVYRIYDTENNKSIIGRQDQEVLGKKFNGTDDSICLKDKFIRVGYPLDLSEIKENNTSTGWKNNKRYTYTIQLGTASATNGILLDPDYKDEAGSSLVPKEVVDNPVVDPGNPVTPGTINFTVKVDDWKDNDNALPIN